MHEIAGRVGPRALLLAVAVLGALLCAVATLVSYWAVAGGMPLVLSGPVVNRLATLLRAGNMPVEFWGFVWFTAVALVQLSWWPRQSAGVGALVFLSAVPVSGYGLWLSWNRHFPCYPVIVSAIAALTVLVVASGHLPGSARAWWHHMREDAGWILHSARRSLSAVAFVLLVAGAAWLIGLRIQSASPSESRERDYRAWYLAQEPLLDPALRPANGIRVVAFTDYQCPFCARALPEGEAVVEDFGKTIGQDVEFIVRDFPLDSACNPAVTNPTHPVACEAAAAIRLVRGRMNAQAVREWAHYFYARGTRLSQEMIDDKLAGLELLEEFRRRRQELFIEVGTDAAAGASLGVRATPTLFVNGKRLPSWHPADLRRALEYEHELQRRTSFDRPDRE